MMKIGVLIPVGETMHCDFCNSLCLNLAECSSVACRDFCTVVGEEFGDIRVMSEREVITLGLVDRAFATKGDWLACPICADLILDSRWDLIEERAIRSLGYIDASEENGVRNLLRASYSVIRAGFPSSVWGAQAKCQS